MDSIGVSRTFTALRAGLTTRGRSLIAAGLACIACGLILAQRDLLRVGCLLVALPIVAVVLVSRRRLTLRASRSVSHSRFRVGDEITASVSVTGTSVFTMGGLMLEDTLPRQADGVFRFTVDTLHPQETRAVTYQLPPLPRGRYEIGPLTLRLVDAFGLVELHRSFETTSPIVILPAVTPLTTATLPTAREGVGDAGSRALGISGIEDISIREYRLGDDLRKVHWRSTARTGQMMVRQDEQPWDGEVSLVIDDRASAHRGTGMDSSFEWTVAAAASIAEHLVRRGYQLAIIVGGARRTWSGSGALADLLADVSPARRATVRDLMPLLHETSADSTVIAIVAGLGSPDTAALAELVRPNSSGLLIGVDALSWTASSEAARIEADQSFKRGSADFIRAGWRVERAGSGDSIAGVWSHLLTAGSGRPLVSGSQSQSRSAGPMTVGNR
jgi:uncharacterized protein (DUF58 family)